MIITAIIKEYTIENGVHIVWHDDFTILSEEKACELIREASAVLAQANTEVKTDVCNLPS
ncbi:MAG: hypothetical protein IJO48_01730 [Clostridia bacterium]|nr:hypothetical protein [Clostridia bacterium]